MKVCILGDARSIHVRRIACGLAQRRLEVTVVTHHPVPLDGVSVHKFQVPRLGFQYPMRWPRRHELYLKRLMRAHDIVQVHFLHDWGFTAEVATEGCLTVTPWGSDIRPPAGSPPPTEELVRKRAALLRMANCIIATCRPFAEQIIASAGIDRDKIRIVPKGVDTSKFATSPTQPRRQPIVGYFKGFREVNGIQHLIEAIPSIRRGCPPVKFQFIGDGPILERCKGRVKELGVDDIVNWLPPQPHDEMPALMDRWSVVAIPSLEEAFCIGALESSAMELPVVASNVGGLVETVRDGLTGILVPPGDPWHLSGGLVELLEDPERGRCMGRAGRRVVQEEYEWSDSLDSLIETYQETLDATTSAVAG
ncbi:MAG: glycosyltransferase family 4 protein [bacterium]|nr:glycosyltransferase family 4 protein [bacterium]